MTALPLAALETQPIRIPVYCNDRIRKFALWFSDNQNAIAAYFNALKPYCAEGAEPLVDFFEFSAIQHEREELKLQESADVPPSVADARPAQESTELGRGFWFDRLPHGGSL